MQANPRPVVGAGARLLLVLLGCAALAGRARADLPPGDYSRSFVFDGNTRQYDFHVPASYGGSAAVPLLLDFHGAGSNKAQQRFIFGFLQRSNLEGFIAVWPQGLFNTWNAGLCCGQAASMGIDDVGFAREVVNRMAAEVNIDLRRVYSTGLSNGGFMTHRLACEAADVFAAFAPMAGAVGITPCQPARPLAMLMFMGLTDALVPYALAAPNFQFWRTNAACTGGSPDQIVTTGTSHCDTYTNCAGDFEVGLCSINCTSPSPFEGHILYLNPDLTLSQVAWDFMSRFSLPVTVDAFKCYKAMDLKDPKFAATTVALSDQFGVNDGQFDVQKPYLLCNPASVEGQDIANPAAHLTCYKIKGPNLAAADRPKVEAENQLGTVQLEAKKPFLLCVPSAKSVLP